MGAIIARIQQEPAIVISLIAAVLTLAAAFGFKLLPEQTAAIMAVVQLVVGLLIRSQVSPTPPKAPA